MSQVKVKSINFRGELEDGMTEAISGLRTYLDFYDNGRNLVFSHERWTIPQYLPYKFSILEMTAAKDELSAAYLKVRFVWPYDQFIGWSMEIEATSGVKKIVSIPGSPGTRGDMEGYTSTILLLLPTTMTVRLPKILENLLFKKGVD